MKVNYFVVHAVLIGKFNIFSIIMTLLLGLLTTPRDLIGNNVTK